MAVDNTSNNQDVSPSNNSTTGDGNAPRPSQTPRHVQWAPKPQVEHVEQILLSDSEGEEREDHQRTLDEHGSDPVALARVHRALESYLQIPPRLSFDKLAPNPKRTRRMTQAADISELAPESSSQAGPSRQGGQPTEQNLDEHVFHHVDDDDKPMLPSARLRDIFEKGGDMEDVVEKCGQAEKKWWEKRARNLVRVHTTSLGRKTTSKTRPKRWKSLPRFQNSSHTQLDERTLLVHDHDLESNTDTTRHIPPLPRGQGVLSTLLTLYQAGGSVSSSIPTSRATTPSDNEQSQPILDEPGKYQRHPGAPASYFDPHASTATGVSPLPDTPAPPSSTCPPEKQTDTSYIPLSVPSSISASLHLPSGKNIRIPTFHTPETHGGRPKAAKNGGGAVGSLIATSSNLRGAAASAPSTVGQNVKKRGFGLSRYEIAPDDGQLELRPINHRRIHSAPTTPQFSSTTDHFDDSAPANNTPGTATPESVSDTTLSRTAGRTAQKHTRTSLATLTEWVPPSLHWGFGRPSTPPLDKSVKDDDARGIFDGGRERRKADRRAGKERRRKAAVFITKHVAEIMQRQEFLVKLARALMMFAAPTHRLQAQIQATARVLDLEVSTLYLPNVMLISFDDAGTSTSHLKFIQQGSSLDLGKLLDAHRLYWKVIHDKISVSSASASLDFLMRKPPIYRGWQTVLLGGLCSSSICSLAFSGSFVDSMVALPLGSLLVIAQNFSTRNELYSNVFEITIATLLSFISAALASTSRICYAAVASSSVVLILPGFIVLSGSLELASRQIVSGAVRICFAVMYSLFLGFGLAMGADVYSRMTGLSVVGPDDYACHSTHKVDGPWWQQTASVWWAFLCVPLYSLFLSLRNQAPMWSKELAVTIFISCGGWAVNHFSGLALVGRPDIQSALGAFAVGVVANTYARFFSGNAYVVMITGILFQLPSGLANGGLLTFAANDNKGQQFESYQAGFQVALQLVAVGIGLTVGLFTSVVVVHPLGGSRRSAAGIFSL